MRGGEQIPREMSTRLEAAVAAVKTRTGLRVGVHLGAVEGDLRGQAGRWVSALDMGPYGAVVLVVDPTARQIEIATSPTAALRLDQQMTSFAVLAATTSFAVGDIIGGLTGALRLIGDAAGLSDGSPPSPVARERLGS